MVIRGFVGSMLVLIGGLVVSTLPRSTPLLQLGLLEAMRSTMIGRMAGLTLVMVGLGLLAGAWLTLCRRAARYRGSDSPGDLGPDPMGAVRLAVVAWSAPLLIAPPLFSRDGWSYAAQGVLAHLGISPYSHGPGVLDGPIVEAVDPRWMYTITPYGPVPLLYGDWLSELTTKPWLLVIGHRMVALFGLVLLAWAVPRLASWAGANPVLAAAIVLPSPFMLANGVGGLHNDLLMVGLMAAALVIGVERGWAYGAALGGIAAAVKLPGGLVCLAIALASLPAGAGLLSRGRRFFAVGVVSVGTLAGLGVVAGFGFGFVDALSVPGSVNTPLSLPTVLGGVLDWVAATTVAGLPSAWFVELLRAAGTVGSAALLLWAALRRPTGDAASALRTMVVVMGGLLMLSPVVHPWYLLWLVPLIAAIPLPRWGTSVLLAGSVIFGLVAPLDSSLHGAYLIIVLGCVYVALLAGVLLVTRPARDRLARIVEHSGIPAATSFESRHPIGAQQVGPAQPERVPVG